MGDNAEIIENMWARIEQCRRLAALIHNPEASRMLLEMAEKGEADVKKLIAEHRDNATAPAAGPNSDRS